MKTKWKMILALSWVLTVVAFLSAFESCRTERYENELYRSLRAECAMQQGHVRQTSVAILKELDGLPEEKQARIFGLLKDQDERIEEFQRKHEWHGGPQSITDLMKGGTIDPTTSRTVPPEAGASGVQ